MRELVPNHLVSQILQLNLEMRIISGNKVTVPIMVKGRYQGDAYKVLLDMGRNNFIGSRKVLVELKGKVDVEYLKYAGEAIFTPIIGESGCYKMKVLSMYKINERTYKRVPYRRAIQIIEPIECEAVLINISGSGAMIHSTEKIASDSLTMAFTLLKKDMVLEADIIEQKYLEEKDCYCIRCHFNPIHDKDQKIILQAVKGIILSAKKRLRD